MSTCGAFIAAFLGLCLLADDVAADNMFDAPLPLDVFVMEPAPGVSAELKAFSGKWVGKLIGAQIQMEHTIVVERMDPNLAWVVWSVGAPRSIVGGGQAAWFRTPGQLTKSELVLYIGASRAVYTLEGSDEVKVVSTLQGFRQKGTLKRVPMLTQPFAEKQPPTYWPTNIRFAQPGITTSPVKAVLPESLVVSPATPDTPPERARWLGRWSGTACVQASCDLKLAVLSVEGEKARIIQMIGATWVTPNLAVRDAVFEGDELILRSETGLRVAYRMRPSGVVEMLRVAPNGTLAWGSLAKEP
jgi:hypothetical protein